VDADVVVGVDVMEVGVVDVVDGTKKMLGSL
jgi:hypothetical protein